MPHVVDVRCPGCGEHASFEVATCVRIRLKKDVEFFKQSKSFEYRFVVTPSERWHAAYFFAGLSGTSVNTIKKLPPGYVREDWAHSRYWWIYTGSRPGTVVCTGCGLRRKHVLKWPADAFYSIAIRGKSLWAFNRETLMVLRTFIGSSNRNTRDFKLDGFLHHVPKNFLTAKVREEITRKLDALLSDS